MYAVRTRVSHFSDQRGRELTLHEDVPALVITEVEIGRATRRPDPREVSSWRHGCGLCDYSDGDIGEVGQRDTIRQLHLRRSIRIGHAGVAEELIGIQRLVILVDDGR